MGIRDLFRAAAAPEPPWIDLPCPGCGSTAFRPGGGQQVRPRTNGTKFRLEVDAALLTCLQCGKPWYTTAHGLRAPHEGAISADSGVEALLRKAREGAAVAPGSKNGGRDESKVRRRVPGPHEGFALPPKVE